MPSDQEVLLKEWAREDLHTFVGQLRDDLERWRVAACQGARHSPPPSHAAYEALRREIHSLMERSSALLVGAYPSADTPTPSP